MSTSWRRPVHAGSEPRWGHDRGLQIGIAPLPGPRGLLRVYTPYLEHPPTRLINFIAVEPVALGATERGLSELEMSSLDPEERGKRMWSADADDLDAPQPETTSARPHPGIVDVVDGVERLTVHIGVERFDNGAHVALRVRFREDRPREVELVGIRLPSSAPLASLILTATMGNWARLRMLHLADRTAEARSLWPDLTGSGFAAHARFGLGELARDGRAAVVTATGDELDPESAEYAPGTPDHWRFVGLRAVQGWRVDDPDPGLEVLVNARRTYWASESPIPGGAAFENFEVVQPYRPEAAVTFFVEPRDL